MSAVVRILGTCHVQAFILSSYQLIFTRFGYCLDPILWQLFNASDNNQQMKFI